ncbi:MAG: CRISPR-associated endonuclease Cas2 [Candidatus Daviesbacteria bacterium]|nr:MAG: CRISPR-associated endonuclease Cas2 [Candidatus Daviesbacteria bacterium]
MGKLPDSKKKKVTNFILLALEKSIDGYVRYDDLIHKPKYYAWGSSWDYPLKKVSLAKALQRLRKGGFIELIDDKELMLRLTDKGKEKAILAQLQYSEKKWDGKYRIVIFDIPEKRRAARDLLRHNLKSWGFTPWQQSVWVTKKNCTKLLRKYIENIGIEDWVLVIESDNIGR